MSVSRVDVGFGVLGTGAMTEPKKNEENPFAFWLVERFLPHEEEPDSHEPMSDFQFALSLAGGLVLIVVAGILIRGCTI